MKPSAKYLLIFIFFLFVTTLFVKSLTNGLRILKELKRKPTHPNISICPPKSESYFKNLTDGGYLYALYKYESMGIKCKKS